MSDRKAELERKRAKLQAFRDEQQRRRRDLEQRDVDQVSARVGTGNCGDDHHRQELDRMLSSVGVAPVSDILLGSPSSLEYNSAPDTSPASLSSMSHQVNNAPRKAVQLSQVSVQSTDIPPIEQVTYSKQTQTSTATGSDDVIASYGMIEDEEMDDMFQSKLPPGMSPHGLPHVKEVQPAMTSLETRPEDKKVEILELSEVEKKLVMSTEDFQHFFFCSSRLMEHVLGETVDIFVDYTGAGDGEDTAEDKRNARLSLNRQFHDDRWSRNRTVTSLDWSPQFPELLLASYNTNVDAPHDPDGTCLIWNTKSRSTSPENVFNCQSEVLSATFARFHPNLILGGTYSGQIVLWDNRVQKHTPIQRTPLSSSTHTQPVYCLRVVGAANSHNLVSISTDGRLCSWSLEMLSAPLETLDLQYKTRVVAATCLAFPGDDTNNFKVGSEDGAVYSACRHGIKAGVTETYEGHQGPITGISTHDIIAPTDFDTSHLFLTSSLDWTVKLWSKRQTRPLYTFRDNNDYAMDVAWSPIHPALFASVDSTGQLDLWDLNQDTEMPAASIVVEGMPALNRVSWTQSGMRVAVGDDMGKIWLYDVGEQLAQPRSDAWKKFKDALVEIENNRSEEENDKMNVDLSKSSMSPAVIAQSPSIMQSPSR